MSTVDPVLEALWKRVTDDFTDEPAHGAFLEYCRASDRLVEAAVRYRGMAGDRERAEMAEKKLKAVAMLAMAQLETSRSAPPPPARRSSYYTLLSPRSAYWPTWRARAEMRFHCGMIPPEATFSSARSTTDSLCYRAVDPDS